ncbi:MAG: hypothetical protein AAGG08_06015 [Actinomycetota bacterium]
MSSSTSAGAWRRARVGTAGVGLVTALVAVTVVSAPGPGAATAADPTLTPIVIDDSVERVAGLSDDGGLVLLSSRVAADPDAVPPVQESSVVRLHDRVTGVTTDVGDTGSTFAALSGDGCVVAIATPIPAPVDDVGGSTGGGDAGSSDGASDAGGSVDGGDTSGTVDGGDTSGTVDGGDTSGTAEGATGSGPDESEPDESDPDGLTTGAEPIGDFEISVVDRCAAGLIVESPTTTVVAELPVVAPLALDSTGATLVANTGGDIVRFARTVATVDEPATPFVVTDRFDAAPVADDDSATTGPVDVSADGLVIVFQTVPAVAEADADPDPDPGAGDPDTTDDAGEPGELTVWDDGVVTTLLASTGDASMSADGRRIVAVTSPDPADPDATSSIVLLDRGAPAQPEPAVRTVPIAGADAGFPSISGDGAHIFFVMEIGDVAGVRRVTWTGGAAPFDSVTETDLGEPLDGGERLSVPDGAAAVSRLGDVIVTAAAVDADALVRTVPGSLAFAEDSVGLGTGQVGTSLAASVTLTNDGDSTFDLDTTSISVGSPFELGTSSTPCVGVLRPGGSCTIDVDYLVAAAIDVVADLVIADATGAVIVTAEVSASGTPVPTTTATTTTTTTTRPPVATTPNTTPATTPNTTPTTQPASTRPSSSGSTGGTTQTTTRPTTTVAVEPTFSPAAFEFAPTIVDAGRRTATIALNNAGADPIDVLSLVVEPADAGFGVDPGSCLGALGGRSSCSVDLVFAPITDGDLDVTVIATFADGDQVRATLSGFGAPPPSVAVVPQVATTGQVVAVRGAGFPAGAEIVLRVGADPVPRNVTINDVGGFDATVLVLPNTSPGPFVIRVDGQLDLFPDVETSMLVTATSSRTSPAVLRGAGPNIGR